MAHVGQALLGNHCLAAYRHVGTRFGEPPKDDQFTKISFIFIPPLYSFTLLSYIHNLYISGTEILILQLGRLQFREASHNATKTNTQNHDLRVIS